jgi:hypothetical protein
MTAMVTDAGMDEPDPKPLLPVAAIAKRLQVGWRRQ